MRLYISKKSTRLYTSKKSTRLYTSKKIQLKLLNISTQTGQMLFHGSNVHRRHGCRPSS